SVFVSATPTAGLPPLGVSFSSAGTLDPDGDALIYQWDFGDFTTSSSPNPTHTYIEAGEYTAKLTVSDGADTSFKTIDIVVGNPPVGEILTPSDGTMFVAGEQISLSGDATDMEDVVLPDSAFSWTVIFHHAGHVHPGTGPVNGVRNLTFNIPASGHDFNGDTSYEIVLTVTDSDGLHGVSRVYVFPDKVNLSIDTVPSGLTVELDGI